ncbi:MAG: S8 family peptidase [Caulobacter sp.]|nr:S8 family peptidase [Caulobacter sp.]
MTKRNFLLGKGERLVEDIVGKTGGGPKAAPYTFAEAKSRLTPMVSNAVSQIENLPDLACPDDRAVASVTLNPEYIAKSYFPADLFRAIGVELIGSKPKTITPEKRSKDRQPEPAVTTELFVVGDRSAFSRWAKQLPLWIESTLGAQALAEIEEVSAPTAEDKIKGTLPKEGALVYEVVLHADGIEGEVRALAAFRKYLLAVGVSANLDRRFYAGGLCFVEVEASASEAEKIAAFTLVRAVRQMPPLRMLRPTIPRTTIPGYQLILPSDAALDTTIKAAIFDGGIPDNHPITAWATPIDATGVGPAAADCLEHGVAVTSAFLFGHIEPTKPVARPFCHVDHYRVLDDVPISDPHELYDVLQRVENALASEQYDLVNLSLGPELPIEDDDVHAWTAVLDTWLSRNNALLSVAVGNGGERDALTGLNRIQVPSDAVNALAVGAADTPDANWARAPYSCVGPGRSPGLIKPDLVEFGGSIQRPFLVVGPDMSPTLQQTGGTSFAAPSTLRMGAGVRAHFGNNLNLLAIRALLVHSAEPSELSREEVGWGRLARNLDDIVVCDDDCVRVVYQGEISPAKYIRAPIPVPAGVIAGHVEIDATVCYSTDVDPHHPGNYTRAGLEVAFRPHSEKRKNADQLHANTKSFFGSKSAGVSEDLLRRDALKWESCQHAGKRLQGRSLHNPVFDIHYNARLEGHNHALTETLKYALVVTVRAKSVTDFYDQIVRRYPTQLEQLRPVIDIPIRV